ncbi:VWA domain-containing protein [Turicibacter bilis]|uniref:VWA domain-containing protein n=1 Tax=Turicibacter bilis TaxID=2735723 RepID=UPI003F8BDE23
MKRVKDKKTRVQKYQSHINRKISAVCAMTLSVSMLLSPFTISANNTSYPILISSVSEELTQSDDYVNVALSYHDIEETQLSVTMDVNVSLDSIVTDDEQVDIIEQSEDNKQENLEGEQLPESEENPTEVEENSIDDSTEESVEEIEESTENNISESSEVPSGETGTIEPSTEEIGDEESVIINENTESVNDLIEEQEAPQEENIESMNDLIEEQEAPQEENIESMNDLIEEQEPSQEENIESQLTESVAFGQLNSVFNRIGQWIMKVLKPFIVNSRVIVEASELQEKSVMIDFPIHSSFSLDESTLKILGANDEELHPSSFNIGANRVTLGFNGDVPEQFSVFFILDRSESIESGDVIVNDGAVIQYRVEGTSETSEIKLPTMNTNLYLLTNMMPLPSLESSFYQLNSLSDESSDETLTTQQTIELNNGNILYLDKVAEEQGDRSYLITLHTSGTVQVTTSVNKADIVLVVDISGSMSDKIRAIKKSIKQFTKSVLAINDTYSDTVRVAIVTYETIATNLLATTNNNSGFVNTYTTKCKNGGSICWNPNRSSVEYKIDNISYGGGTNTDAGIKMAGNLLTNNGRSDANKYVVFFTDGLPTYNSTYSGNSDDDADGNGNSNWDRNFRAAQISYYENFVGPLKQTNSNEITIGGIGSIRNNQNNNFDGKVTYTIQNQSPLNARFYSIGLFTDSTDEENQMAINFLQTIQNVIDKDNYADRYYTNDITRAQVIYSAIEQDILSEVTGNLLDNKVTITDIVPSYFNVIRDSFNVQPKSISVDEESGGTRITWEFDHLSAVGVDLSFKIEANDYFGAINSDSIIIDAIGINGVYTNESATIVGTEIPNGAVYPIPTVTIAPVQGGIKVVKEVKKGESQYETNDTFSINVTGESNQLGFEVTGNTNQTVSFYLRNSDTDITYNKDYSKNYLMIGEYLVDEFIPANYAAPQIEIKKCTDSTYQSCTLLPTQNKTFTLDKTQPYILITVKNNLSNENYWYDKVHKPNRFTYTKQLSGAETSTEE